MSTHTVERCMSIILCQIEGIKQAIPHLKQTEKTSSNLKQLQLISTLNNGLKNSPVRNQETSVNIPQMPSNHIAAYFKLPVHTDFTFDYPSEELPPHQGTGFVCLSL